MACQLELFTLLDPAQRTNVTFLGEVVLTKSKLSISKDVVAEIASVSYKPSCTVARLSTPRLTLMKRLLHNLLVQYNHCFTPIFSSLQIADVLAYRNVQNMIATAYSDKSAPVKYFFPFAWPHLRSEDVCAPSREEIAVISYPCVYKHAPGTHYDHTGGNTVGGTSGRRRQPLHTDGGAHHSQHRPPRVRNHQCGVVVPRA